MEKIYTTPNPVEIDYLQEKLSEADIQSQIVEDRSAIIATDGYVYNYSIIVNDEDLARANEIVNEFRAEQQKSETKDTPWCPECGSDDIDATVKEHKHGAILFLILAPLFAAIGVYAPVGILLSWLFIALSIASIIQYFRGYTTYYYHCKKCGHKFKRH